MKKNILIWIFVCVCSSLLLGGVKPNPLETYKLTVVNGTGGGNYLQDRVITVTAAEGGANGIFSHWTVTGLALTDAESKTNPLTIVMPANDVTLTANMINDGKFTVNVDGQVLAQQYEAGEIVSLTASTPALGKIFYNWSSSDINLTPLQEFSPSTSFVMPAKNVVIRSNYANESVFSPASDFLYECTDTEVKITDYIGKHVTVNVPPNIEGKPVTTLARGTTCWGDIAKYINLPDSVLYIRSGTFQAYGNHICNVRLSANLLSIESNAFYYCSWLTSLRIPASLTYFAPHVFDDCNVEEIEVDENNQTYCSQDGLVLTKDKTKLILCPRLKNQRVVIPESVVEIGDYAFTNLYNNNNQQLYIIILPKFLTKIGRSAFYECYGIDTIVIPENVTYIDNYAFNYCSRLETIVFAGSKPAQENTGIFYHCSSNAKIYAFANKGWTEGEQFGGLTVTLIEKHNLSLNNSIIGKYHLGECITVQAPNPPNGKVFKNWNCEGKELSAYDRNTETLTFIMPNNAVSLTPVYENYHEYTPEDEFLVETIDSQIKIKGYSGERSVIKIPPTINGLSVTEIGADAFANNTDIVSIDLPDSIQKIQARAFYKCSSLLNVNFGNNLSYIGNEAFRETGIKDILFPESLTELGQSAFYLSKLESVNIPASLKNIKNRTFYGSNLNRIIISEGVESIGESAFYNCDFESLHLPASLKTIGDEAFYNTGTYNITVADNSQYFRVIDGILYTYDLKELVAAPVDVEELVVPNGVEIIKTQVFEFRHSLSKIAFPDTLTTIMTEAFSDTNLEEVYLPKSCISIYLNAFPKTLKTITVDPENPVLQSIDGVLYSKPIYNMLYCPYANPNENLIIPDGVRILGGYSNSHNTEVDFTLTSSKLKYIYVPYTVEKYTGQNYLFSYGTSNNVIEFDGKPISYSNTNLSSSTILAWPGMGWETLEKFGGGTIVIREGVTPPVISQQNNTGIRNFNNNTTIEMTNTNNTSGLVLRYTLDGSTPTGSSTAYTQPFNISQSCIIAARYFKDGDPYSGVVAERFEKVVDIEEVFSGTGLNFENDTNNPWTGVQDSSFDGRFVARTGEIGNSQSTSIQTTVTGQGTISFYWKISSEKNYDKLKFFIDGTEAVTSISGNINWVEVNNVEVTGEGNHILKWTYSKDSSRTDGEDCGWIADIKWVPAGNQQTISLLSGWNWVSFHILPSSHKIGDVLGTAGFTVNDVIQSSTSSSRFNGTSWIPSSFSIEYGKLYMIYVSNPVTLTVLGTGASSTSLSISAGWNWIANPKGTPITPSQLKHSGGWSAGDCIQGASGSVTYSGSKWIPSTGFTIEPGKGYQIRSAKAGTISF